MRQHIIRSAAVCLAFFSVYCAAQTVPVSKDTKEIREENSKLFNFYATFQSMEDSLPSAQKVADNTYIVVRKSKVNPSQHLRIDLRYPDLDPYMGNAAVNCDLIVVVEPRESQSDFTQQHKFVFSDYTAVVDKVLYAKKSAMVLPGQQIVITRPGGIVQMDGKRVFGSIPGYQLFQLNKPYLMFLTLMPNGSYWINSELAYLLGGPNVKVNSITHNQDIPVDRKIFDQAVEKIIVNLRRAEQP